MSPQIDQIKSIDENHEQSTPVDQQEDIPTVQKYLLALIFIQWFAFVLTLLFGIYMIFTGDTIDASSGLKSLFPIVLFVLYYTSGLLITWKRHERGLLIFAYIGVVLFIIVCIFLGYILLSIIALDIGFGGHSPANEFIVFLIIFLIAIATIAIITLKLSFDLARLIKTNEYLSV